MFAAWWTDTVTVYNRRMVNGVVSWDRKVYHACYFKSTAAKTTTQDYTRSGGEYICRIPYEVLVSVGDIVCKGSVSDSINEYTNGVRSTDFLEKYAGRAFIVRGVGNNFHNGTLCKHLKITGN